MKYKIPFNRIVENHRLISLKPTIVTIVFFMSLLGKCSLSCKVQCHSQIPEVECIVFKFLLTRYITKGTGTIWYLKKMLSCPMDCVVDPLDGALTETGLLIQSIHLTPPPTSPTLNPAPHLPPFLPSPSPLTLPS